MKNLKPYIAIILLSLFFTISCEDDGSEENNEEIIQDENTDPDEDNNSNDDNNDNEQEEVVEKIIKPSFKFDIEKKYVLPEFVQSDEPLNLVDPLFIQVGITSANQNILNNDNILNADELTPDDKPTYFFDGTVVTDITAAENRVKDIFPENSTCLTDSDIFTKRYLWASSTSEFEEAILGNETLDALAEYTSYVDAEVGETDTHFLYAEKYSFSNINDPSIKEYNLYSWKVKKGDFFEGCLVVSLINESQIRTSEWKEENNTLTVSTTYTQPDGSIDLEISYTMNTDKSGELFSYGTKTKYTWTSDGVITKETIE